MGGNNALQHARAKSWIALSCIHADLACLCVAVRQPNPYNDDRSTRCTDILIDQYKIDSVLTNKKSEQSIASKRRSGALTKQAFLPPLDECGRYRIDLRIVVTPSNVA